MSFDLWNVRDEQEIHTGFPLWMKDAACSKEGQLWDLFFSEDDSAGESTETVHAAKRYCFGCVVRPECLRFALMQERGKALVGDGIWGGLTPAERNMAAQANDPVAMGLGVLDEQVRVGAVLVRAPRWNEGVDDGLESGSYG